MELKTFLEFVVYISNEYNITIEDITKDGKCYEMEYSPTNEIKPDAKYWIDIDGNGFKFKSSKVMDNLFKTFVTQYINKVESKKLHLVDGAVVEIGKAKAMENLKSQFNTRVTKGFKGTDGEWNVVKGLSTDKDLSIHSNGRIICEVLPDVEFETNEDTANAKLLGASKDLLKALQGLLKQTFAEGKTIIETEAERKAIKAIDKALN